MKRLLKIGLLIVLAPVGLIILATVALGLSGKLDQPAPPVQGTNVADRHVATSRQQQTSSEEIGSPDEASTSLNNEAILRAVYLRDAETHLIDCHNKKQCRLEQKAFAYVYLKSFTGDKNAMTIVAALLSDPKSKSVRYSVAWPCIWQMVAHVYPDHAIDEDTIRATRTKSCDVILADDGLITLALEHATNYRDTILKHPLTGSPDLSPDEYAYLLPVSPIRP